MACFLLMRFLPVRIPEQRKTVILLWCVSVLWWWGLRGRQRRDPHTETGRPSDVEIGLCGITDRG